MPDQVNQNSVSLPRINLIGKDIPFDVFTYIPYSAAEKYGVIPFYADERVLRIAVSNPEQVKKNFGTSLLEIGKKISRKIEIYQTEQASLVSALGQYKEKTTKVSPPPVKPVAVPINGVQTQVPQPPLFKLGQSVAFNYLRRVPLQFAKDNRLVSVDHVPPNIYWFLTDGTKDNVLTRVMPYLEEKNKIKIHLLKVAPKDLDDLLVYYTQKSADYAKEKAEQEAAAKAEEERKQKDPEAEKKHTEALENAMQGKSYLNGNKGDDKTVTLAQGVVVPDIQATIIDTQEEKSGIAGIFQKISQNISVRSEPILNDSTDNNVSAKKLTGDDLMRAVHKASTEAAEKSGVKEEVHKSLDMSKDKIDTNVDDPVKQMTDKQTDLAKQNTATDEDNPDIGRHLSKPVENLDELKEHIKRGFIPAIVAAIVSYAIHEKASDIHVECFEDEVRVRYRVDGQLMDVIKLPPDIHAAMVSRIKILSKLKLDETRVPQDGRFDVEVNDKQIDLRVSIMPTVHGEKVVMRILEKSKGVTSLEELGLMGRGYKNLLDSINKPYGVCLAAGPTGSGKSTSLYAILNLIATSNVNVITLEDPVEYEMKGVNQSQIRPKIGFTFAEGLRSVLRQDPNIIMVGEIRDGETANMATQAALTGHLVLSTLHTNEATGAVPRLTNMGIEPFLIASSVNVVMGQRLVRRICQHCKVEVNMPQGVRDHIVQEVDAIANISEMDYARVSPPFKFYQGVGCEHCKGKGYQGRIGIFEVLKMTEAIEDLTLKRASAAQLQEQAQKEGMITMYQDGLLKVAAGLTTLDEVLRETANK